MRLLHIGLGPLGVRFLTDYADRRVAEPIGVVDISPQLAGKPLRALVKKTPFDLPILSSLDEFRHWDAIDAAVVTTASDLRACADTFRTLLARGVAVISTCEELTWPYLRHPDLSRELHALALANDGRLLGTGVNP